MGIFDESEYFELHLPVAIINNGENAGTVYKCAVTLSSTENTATPYFMIWDKFLKFDPLQYRYAYEDVVHPFIFTSNFSLHKLISFAWDDPENKFRFNPGEYELCFYF